MPLSITVTDVRILNAVLSGPVNAPTIQVALEWLDSNGNVVSTNVDTNPVPSQLLSLYAQFVSGWLQIYKSSQGIS